MVTSFPKRILIVDDEPNMLHMLSSLLEPEGFEPVCARTGEEALNILEHARFDIILSDIRMPEMDGISLVEHIRERGLDVLIILMSAYGSVELALEAMRRGAYDYISKPFKTDEVVLTLRKAAERERLRREVVRLRRALRFSDAGPEMVVASPVMSEVLGIVEEAAQFDSAILVTGDSGTGKELVARQVHRRSPRSEGPFVPVNCAALPENLLESELFGHARGAFTGATSAKAGLFEEADGGTLFLDEIGSMAPSLQAKLLRVLEDGHVRRIGENKTRQVSVRIVAATNEQLEAARQRGSFREDLYFRLSVIEIHVPSLKHRIEDILPLVEHFVCIFNKKMGKKVRHIDREAQDALMSYDWKGNVRELQNVVERAMILAEGDSITRACLPEDITTHGSRVMSPESNLWEDLSLKKATKNLEKNLIVAALNRTGGNRSHAAALLEISYPSLLSKIKEYELR